MKEDPNLAIQKLGDIFDGSIKTPCSAVTVNKEINGGLNFVSKPLFIPLAVL